VRVRALEDALEHGEVGDDAARGERLPARVDELVAVLADDEVGVARVHGAAEEEVPGGGELLDRLDLRVGRDEPRGPRPEVVVAEELADGSVAAGDRADHLVRGVPRLPAAAVLRGAEERDEARVLEERDLLVGARAGTVALDLVDGEDVGDLAGARDPRGRRRGTWGALPAVDGGGAERCGAWAVGLRVVGAVGGCGRAGCGSGLAVDQGHVLSSREGARPVPRPAVGPR
jgi:hypothetical protein